MENAYTKTTEEVLKYFSVSEAKGLTEEQVKESRRKHGRNGRIACAAAVLKANSPAQQSQKNLQRPSGSSSSSNSRISLLSSFWDLRLFH
jgi:hypothetical protein